MTIPPFFKRKIFYIPAILVVLIAGRFFLFSDNGEAQLEMEIVGLSTVTQIVSETGIVKSSQAADLSLEQSGKVSSVPVRKGNIVAAGDVLVQLDTSEQSANVLSAQAQLRAEEANLASVLQNSTGVSQPGSNLSVTQKQQAVLIENAYSKLLSEGLIMEPENNSYYQTPPVILGRYLGAEGVYKVTFSRGKQVDDYLMSVFNLEIIRDVEINSTAPTSLGTRGLYVSFPDPIADYMDTVWYVVIPNTKSSTYLANYNAYLATLKGSEVALAQIGQTTESIAVQEARVDQARAALATAEVNLNKRTLRAPFAGIISDISISRGETVSAGLPVVSLISKDKYEIEVNIPEDDIAFVTAGDEAEIKFDAYDNVIFQATVVFVSPSARIIDGVTVFEVTLQFKNQDERIRAGLSVDVDIITEEKNDVIAIPTRAVIEERGVPFVRVMVDKNSYRQQAVALGLRGEGGLVEIVAGLKTGDNIITFADKDVLTSLNKIE
jgi:RND family efflux transporter MFP subunit